MLEILQQLLRESWSDHSLSDDEIDFWSHPAKFEKLCFRYFVDQDGYDEHAKLVLGPGSKLEPYCKVEPSPEVSLHKLPTNVASEAGFEMAEWDLIHREYSLQSNKHINIQVVCRVRRSSGLYDCSSFNDIEKFMEDALVFNVRFHLGRKFSRDSFSAKLTEFLDRSAASAVSKLKIAFWEHDVLESNGFEDADCQFAIQNFSSISVSLTKHLERVSVIALEKRIMKQEAREAQKQMHLSPVNESELAWLNAILTGSADPL